MTSLSLCVLLVCYFAKSNCMDYGLGDVDVLLLHSYALHIV